MKFSKEKSRILIVSHFLLNPIENDSAASSAIRNFLLPQVKEIVQIEQPFTESPDKFCHKLEFVDGKLKSEINKEIIKSPMWAAYLLHPLIMFFQVLTSRRYNLAIACENLSCLALIPLRRLGIISKLVYYSVDYVPQRFERPIVNSVYHLLDRMACYNSDVNWVVSNEQISGRHKNGVSKGKSAPFKVVPIGYRLSEIEVLPVKKIKYFNLVFAGSVRQTAGPQLIIDALPKIIKKFPKVKVTFAGGGEYIKDIKSMAKKLGVLGHLEFLGYVDKHSDMLKAVTNKSIGLAPYVWDPRSISMTSDPAKIKIYLCCGIPVITTKIATSWPIIKKGKSGKVIDFDKDELAGAVIDILKNKETYMKYKNSAIELSKEFDVDRILAKAFSYV